MRVFRYSRALSWTVGLGLAQVGEFAFVIAKAGQHSGNLSAESFSLMIAVTVVSMVATPAFFWIGEFISKGSQAEDPLETSNVIEHEVPIVVRVEEVEDIDTLSSLTVEEIVQPQLEVGLEMVRQSLLSLGIDEARVFTLLGQLRAERYEPMRHPNNRLLNDARFLTASKFLEFLWIEINDTSPLVNVSISGSGMRER
ncbi:hypothetical protein EB061_12265, partial [bacterium]|nr:hypothetical protein [bacterium]